MTGTGNAAALTIAAPIVLDGSFTAGSLTVDVANGIYYDATLYAGAALHVSGNTTLASALNLDAGSSFSVGGTLTLDGGAYFFADLSLSGGASVSVGALAAQAGNIYLDAASSLAVIAHGQAGAGTFLVGAGAVASVNGDITAPTLNVVGTLDTTNTTLLVNSLAGTGTIGFAGLLALDPDTGGSVVGGAKLTLSFDQGGTLELGRQELGANGAFLPTIANFGTDDTIVWAGQLTGATDSNGKLTLFEGTSTVATLTLAGDYGADTFKVLPDPYTGTSDITVAPDQAAAAWAVPQVGGDDARPAASAHGGGAGFAPWHGLDAGHGGVLPHLL